MMLDQATIRALFVYEPETGMLRKVGGRKPYPWRKIGTDGKYLAHTHQGQTIYLHQAIWLYHHGEVPPMLDHKDRDTKNSRIENLRVCTGTQNLYNARRRSDNKSGFKGVIFRPMYRHPWQARIVVDGKQRLIGRFDSPQEAHQAYLGAASIFAGEFARGE